MEENENLLGLKELDYLPFWPLIPDTDYQYQGSTLDPPESPSERSYETPCESLSESSCESPYESSYESSYESPLANSYESQAESSNFEECDQILLDPSSTPFDETYTDVDANMKTKLFETDDEEQLYKRLQESSEFFDSSCDEVIHEEDPTQYSPQNFQKDMSQENELFDVPIFTNTVLNEIESFSNQDEYFPFSPYNSSPQISWKFVSQQQVITSPNFQPQPQPQIQPHSHSHSCSRTKAQGKAQAHFPSQYQMTSGTLPSFFLFSFQKSHFFSTFSIGFRRFNLDGIDR